MIFVVPLKCAIAGFFCIIFYLSQSGLVEVVFEVVLSAMGAGHELHEARLDAGLLERRPDGGRLLLGQPRLEQRRKELQPDALFDEMLLKDGA